MSEIKEANKYPHEVIEILSEFNAIIHGIVIETVELLTKFKVPVDETALLIQSQMASHIAELFRYVKEENRKEFREYIVQRLEKQYVKRILNNEGCGNPDCLNCGGGNKNVLKTDGTIH